MTGEAMGPVGPRRASGGEVLLLVAALLLTPRLFVLAPLAGLLAAARPSSGRSRFFTVLAFVLVAIGVASADGLLDRVVTAWAVLSAGAFALLGWRGSCATLFGRTTSAVAIGAGLTVLVAGMYGVTWAGLERYAARQLSDALTAMLEASGGNPDTADVLAPIQAQVSFLAALLPAQLALGQVVGMALAWRWHEWTADEPLPPAAAPFVEFRFGEAWIWGVIVALALLLVGAEGAVWSAAANALLFFGACYAVRGAAVVRARMPPIGPIAAILYAVAAAVLAVFVLGALIALGLADNWFDFRRQTPDSSPKGQLPWK